MTDKVCSVCNGNRFHVVNDTTVRSCICTYVDSLKSHLGLEIASAATIKSSPLLSYDKSSSTVPSVDLTSKNLFIKGHWDDVRSHLKWALACKGLSFRFKITTDERLKAIYLGQESYGSRSRKTRDELETFNNISDFVGDDYRLVIIRLGFLGYKNQAMPGILKETLLMRDSMKLPTWVVEDLTNPFNQTHSYSIEVERYLNDRYQTVLLGEKKENAVSVGFSTMSEDPVVFAEETPRRPKRDGYGSDSSSDLFQTKSNRRKKYLRTAPP